MTHSKLFIVNVNVNVCFQIQSKEPTDVIQLLNTLKDKENTMSVMQVRIKAMETTILDLQEKINEKDQIIEAKNKATTLMSDSLSKKGLHVF